MSKRTKLIRRKATRQARHLGVVVSKLNKELESTKESCTVAQFFFIDTVLAYIKQVETIYHQSYLKSGKEFLDDEVYKKVKEIKSFCNNYRRKNAINK